MRTTHILQAALGAYGSFGLQLAYEDGDGIGGALLDQGHPVVRFPDLTGETVAHLKAEAEAYLIEKGVL